MSNWSHVIMQDTMSPLMEQLMFFLDHILVILIVITINFAYMMIMLFFNNLINQFLLEGQLI